MKTIWILAPTLHSAMNALQKNLEGTPAFQHEFIKFEYIGSAEQVREQEGGQTFLVVKGWRKRPDAEALVMAMKERGWEAITLKELILEA